jgi:C4-dicarboxylate transporter
MSRLNAQYNKMWAGGASAGGMTFLIVITLFQVAARNYGIEITEMEMGIIAGGIAVFAGILNGAVVYAIRNAPPELIDEIGDALSEQTPAFHKEQ